MGDLGSTRCALLARAQEEPLAGTAPVARRWAALEHRGAWPRDVAEHPDPSIAGLAARAAASGYRLLLIRRPGRAGAGPVRLHLADTAPGATALTVQTVEGPHDLAAVPLPPSGPLPGEPVTDPLLLVCTHGRRDLCCAVDGRALTTAVAAGEPDLWESSHLGGHRFAPTALVLPTGYLYGRLDPATAVAARKAAAVGEVESGLSRGRSTWSPAGQVAELAVRQATGLRDADALTLDPAAVPGPVLVHARDGRSWSVQVDELDAPPRPASCGATALPHRALTAAAPVRTPAGVVAHGT